MRKSIAAAAIAASASLSGCGHSRAEDAGPVVTRNFPVGNFQQIEVAGPYDVAVRTGSNASVLARGGEKLLEHTTVEVKGDKLVIRPEEHHGLFNFRIGSNGSAHFVVTVPQLSGAVIAGSGELRVDNVKGDGFSGMVAGSGGLSVDNVEVQTLKLAIGGSGTAKAGGGKAQTANYSIGGSGDIQAAGVQAEQAKVSIAGSGSVKANASSTADVSIMGAGDVDVTGGAKCSVSKTGAGDVRCS